MKRLTNILTHTIGLMAILFTCFGVGNKIFFWTSNTRIELFTLLLGFGCSGMYIYFLENRKDALILGIMPFILIIWLHLTLA